MREIIHDFGDLDVRGGNFSADVHGALLEEVSAMLAAARDADAPAPYASFGSAEAAAMVMADTTLAPLPAPALMVSPGWPSPGWFRAGGPADETFLRVVGGFGACRARAASTIDLWKSIARS